ncbi:Protein YLS9 [Morella rubra]|uniref:Protein YLS9 n=1 Tax=Morella rubra TaxID=262757 RepID=A0A6A1VKI4_9ROSI|nr:Protein YLS9 [Morella rubra]
MAEHQKIHPVVDVEAPPTAPLVPRDSCPSEKGCPVQVQRPPPRPHPLPVSHAMAVPKGGNCCCKCICWTIGLLVLLLILFGATAAILYFVFQPKLPTYSVDSLKISRLGLNLDMSLYAEFDVEITTYNPNEKIGIYYEKGGQLSVWYTNTKLCDGPLPKFYQGHRNKTTLQLALTGQTQSGSPLLSALQEQQQTGRIPLDLKVDAPVAIELGSLKLKKVSILGECSLVVDNVSANSSITIKASNCRFGLKL